MIAWILQQPMGLRLWAGLCIVIVGASYCGRLITYDIMNAAKRVRELEIEINKRAGEKLLLWETERGGLNPSYWWGLFLPFVNSRRKRPN
jgi:hypothetical protein